MKTLTMIALSVVLGGCASTHGPLASRALQIAGPFGEIGASESRHRVLVFDVYLACLQRAKGRNCDAEARAATAFTCSGESMPANSYALCLRCVQQRQPDDAECRRLAAAIVAAPDTSIQFGGAAVGPFKPDGTADPPGHPKVGPPPPLR